MKLNKYNILQNIVILCTTKLFNPNSFITVFNLQDIDNCEIDEKLLARLY